MFDDPERYEHDGFYEEDTDYEDEYEADDSDYIVDDEEDEYRTNCELHPCRPHCNRA